MQEPMNGILKHGDYGDAKFYYLRCDCGDDNHSQTIEVEASDMGDVTVTTYQTYTTRFWQFTRWKQIWDILTTGRTEVSSSVIMDELTLTDYIATLSSARDAVKQFQKERHANKK